MQDGTGGYEVIFARFGFFFDDVEVADFKVGLAQMLDVLEIEVGCDHVASRSDFARHPLRDRSVATADFETSPSRTEAQVLKQTAVQRIEKFRHQVETLALTFESMGENVAALHFASLSLSFAAHI